MCACGIRIWAPHGLIPGLPDDVVLNCILSRLSWKTFPSLLRVCKAWRAAFTSGLIASIRRVSPASQERLLGLIHKSRNRRSDPRCCLSLDISLAVSVYDPMLCVWEELPPIPFIPHGAPMFARCVCVNGQLFVLGGSSPNNWRPVGDVYRMDLASGHRKWQKCRGMNTARANFGCICYEGKIIVAGGNGRDSLFLATAELYDVQKDNWTRLPDLNVPRAECLGAVLNNQACILGGYTLTRTNNFYAMIDDPVLEILDEQFTQWSCATSTVVPLHSFTVDSGQLCPLTDSAISNFHSDATATETEHGMLISHFEDDDATYLALTAFSLNQDLYALTRDSLSCRGNGLSFRRGKKSDACDLGTGVVRWQPIDCSFEIVELAAACCTVCL